MLKCESYCVIPTNLQRLLARTDQMQDGECGGVLYVFAADEEWNFRKLLIINDQEEPKLRRMLQEIWKGALVNKLNVTCVHHGRLAYDGINDLYL